MRRRTVLVLGLAALLAASVVIVVAALNRSGTGTSGISRPASTPVLVFGDSYAVGLGASDPSHSWVTLLAAHEGWDVTNVAVGGTGYATTLSDRALAEASCAKAECPDYSEVLKGLPPGTNPDIVLVSGGRNDATHSPTEIAAAVQRFFTELHATYPKARVIAVSPMWDSTTPPPVLAQEGADVSAAVKAIGGDYLDIGQPLQGHPNDISTDKIHPDDSGHALIAKAVEQELAKAG